MGVIWQKKWITGRVSKPNPELVQNKLKSPQKYQIGKCHMIWKPHKWYFFGQEPHKWHLSWRLNQQVTQQLESNSPMGINVSNSPHNLHKNWKLTPQMAQKLETYPTNGRKVGNLPHKWQKSWKLTLQMAQKLETQPTSGTKVGNSPHKWHKGSRQVFRLQWLAQCRRSLTESNKLYIQGVFLTGPPLNLLNVGR